MRYNVKELINILNKFPKDLKIETELALMWNYPDDILKYQDQMSAEEFRDFTINHATDLCIFEGDWEKGIVSDVDGVFKKNKRLGD